MAEEPKKPKKWWRVDGEVTVGAYTYVRADSEEEAKQRASGREPVLSPYGAARSGDNPTESAIVDDADGTFVPTSGGSRSGLRAAGPDTNELVKSIRRAVWRVFAPAGPGAGGAPGTSAEVEDPDAEYLDDLADEE